MLCLSSVRCEMLSSSPDKPTGTLGSLVSFGINFNASALQVPAAVYIVFIVLIASGFFLTCFTILPPSRVRRPDGTPLADYPQEGFWHELKAQRKLFSDWRLLAMFVPLLGSEVLVIVNSTLNCECKHHFPCSRWGSSVHSRTQPCTSTFEPALSTLSPST